ncbi:MAG: hypothetical protein K1X79_01750 [Oligoflexia bacterium]|nr:hypothetical protein [Oligoflexia bacterium]
MSVLKLLILKLIPLQHLNELTSHRSQGKLAYEIFLEISYIGAELSDLSGSNLPTIQDTWLTMLAAEELTIDPEFERQQPPLPVKRVGLRMVHVLGALVIMCEVLFLTWLVDYNLKQVPRSEVERIYRNAGQAVRNSFR